MRILVCFLLLQLSFSVYGADTPEWLTKNLDYPYQAVNLHFINNSNEKCTLTNKLHHISFWSEDYEPHPITLRAGEEFEGYLRFYDECQILGVKPNDRFAMTIGHDVFELHFVNDSGGIFPRLYNVIDGNQYIKAEKKPKICGYVAIGDLYRATQIYSYIRDYENDYYIIIREKTEPEEQRIAEPGVIEQKYIDYARQVAVAAQTAAPEEPAKKCCKCAIL